METKLQRLVLDYQATVSVRFTQLRTELGFDAPESNVAWACNSLDQRGRLSDGSQYFKHGYGCAIKGTSGTVDFDFGACGEIDGFDASRLWGFAVTSKRDFGYASEKEIDAAIKKAMSEGSLRYSGYMLYYVNEKIG